MNLHTLPFVVNDPEKVNVDSSQSTDLDIQDLLGTKPFRSMDLDDAVVGTESPENADFEAPDLVDTESSENIKADPGTLNAGQSHNEQAEAEFSNISDALILDLKQELDDYAQTNTVLKNILISTSDGFEIASLLAPGSELHIRKIAALTSSLLGISSAMLQEMGGGEQNIVFMESSHNMILFNRIPAEQKMLCLMAVTTKDESTGQIFWRLRQLSERVIKICNKHI